jgi:hypothetical protein
MARIVCRTPSTGKPLRIVLSDLGQTLTTIAEAPDFSVPDASEKFPDRDPDDLSRAIRPGEIFFLTPMSVKNKTLSPQSIEVVLLTEDDVSVSIGTMQIPAGDTGFIPIQGRSLLKRNPSNQFGDRLQIRASDNNAFDIWLSAEEKLSSEHSGVDE